MAKFKHVRIIGGSFTTKREMSFESMQEDMKNKQDKVLSLFVFKPGQTGLSAVAEMTAAAINNPTSTAIFSVAPDDETATEQVDRESLLEVLRNESDVPIFEDENSLNDYIDEVVDTATDDALSIVK